MKPRTNRPVCRSMAVDPRTGKVYLSNSAGDILEYDPTRGEDATAVRVLLSGAEGLTRDYFGSFEPGEAGSILS